MRFFEVDSAVDAIMSAAMVAQGRASQQGKVGRLSMNGFLQMLANAGIVMDYEGFKTVFDTNPQLKNAIAKFDKESITFVGDADDESDSYEEPTTDMPDDERVAKMAKRAMRTREFVEAVGDDQLIKPMVNMKGATLKRYGKNLAKKYPHLAPTIKSMMPTEEIETEAELPAHLSKMFGKDGTQVDTRTDVMKQMRDIVDNKSAMKVKFGDGEQMVDMYTASVLTQIYDKVSPENKEKIVQRVGTIEKFTKLMPKLFGMLGEGKSPHKKGTKKYKAHMAAMHAGESVNEGMEDKIKKDIIAGMSTDAIIGKYANKRTTNTDEIRKMIQKIKWNMRKNNEDVQERSLTKAEKSKMKHYEKKLPKQDFIDRYGKEQGEAIYYATATKMAKKNA